MNTVKVEIKKINNCTIKEAKKISDDRPAKCQEIFSDPYSNIFIVARKKSGKSTLISNMIKKIIGRNTHVIVFCSTVHKDPTWISIKDFLKKNGIKATYFLGIIEGKEDHLKQFMSAREQESIVDEDSDEEEKCDFGDERKVKKYFSDSEEDDEDEKFEKEQLDDDEIEQEKFKTIPFEKIKFNKKSSIVKKEAYVTPEYLVIIDDLSNELRCSSLEAYYKRSRHYKCCTISSTQYLNDVKPASLRQQDVVLAFKGLDQAKLKKLYIDCDITNIPFEVFCDLYHNSTKEKFAFFYIGVRDDTFRKNFDKQYFIEV